jgi:glycosyltransferase involved in cell wall biosynthesis
MAESFSVALCTYNGARFLGAQLASLAAQTRPPAELVVCDDRSTDETARVVRDFASGAPFPVRLHVNERNLGSTQNFAKAIGLCEGELIALCDQDDVWSPRKLELVGGLFDSRPEVGLVFTDAELVDEGLRPLGHRLWERIGFGREQRRLMEAGRALDILLPGWTVTGATMAFRARFKPLVLDIPDDLAMIHDGWISIVVATVAGVSFIDEPLIEYRQHAGQQVGAPERPTPSTGEGGVRTAFGRRNAYAELIAIGERVRARLAERASSERFGASALARLDARLSHLRAREAMPVRRLARLPVITRELASGRYRRYANGLYSALKDLLA